MYSVCGLFEGLYKSVGKSDSILKMDNRFGSGQNKIRIYLSEIISKFMAFGQYTQFSAAQFLSSALKISPTYNPLSWGILYFYQSFSCDILFDRFLGKFAANR